MNIKEKWNSLMSSLGISKLESSADGVFMKEEDVDKMAALHAENETLKADALATKQTNTELVTANTNLAAQNADLQKQIETLTAENQALTEKVATLESQPAAAPSAVKKDVDDVSATSAEDKERKKTAAEEKRERLAKMNEFDITKTRLED